MASWTNGTTILDGPMKFVLLCHHNFCPENFDLLHGTQWSRPSISGKKIQPLAWATHNILNPWLLYTFLMTIYGTLTLLKTPGMVLIKAHHHQSVTSYTLISLCTSCF